MMSKESLNRLQRAAPLVGFVLSRTPPSVAQAVLGGFIANIIGPLPDEHWKQMIVESRKPCGVPDCGCEKFKGNVLEALDALREDWKEQVKKY
jgi:hypothetical protein